MIRNYLSGHLVLTYIFNLSLSRGNKKARSGGEEKVLEVTGRENDLPFFAHVNQPERSRSRLLSCKS